MRWVELLRGRGQSEAMGVVLLVSIVLMIAVAMVVAGNVVLAESETTTAAASASQSMAEVDEAVSQLDGQTNQTSRTSISGLGDEGDVAVTDDGRMRVVIDEASGDRAVVNETITLGSIVYRRDGQTVAYQGGVWRSSADSDGSVAVSPPPFEYRRSDGAATVSLPLVRVTGTADGNELVLRGDGEPRSVFPASGTATNPLEDGQVVTVSVTSDYYRGWGAVFEDRTQGTVTYDEASRTVTVVLGARTNATTNATTGGANDTEGIPGAVTTSLVDRVDVDDQAETGSYDSGDEPVQFTGTQADVHVRGSYSPSSEEVSIGGDVVATNASRLDNNDGSRPQTVAGNVTIGGDPTDANRTKVQGHHDVDGYVSTTDDLEISGDDASRRVDIGEDVYVGGDLRRFEYARVRGDVYVRGDLASIGPNVHVNGEVIVGGSIDDRGGPTVTTGGIGSGDPPAARTPSIPSTSSKRPAIEDVRDRITTHNDNSEASDTIDRIEGYAECDPCTLETGDYYFDDGLGLEKETLILDTTDGPIDVYAAPSDNGGLYVANANLTVRGDHPVRFYTTGDVEVLEQDGRGEQAGVFTRPDHYRSPNFELYTVPSARVRFNNDDPVFTGVVFGPGSSDGSEITLTNGASVYGAILGDVRHVNEGARIYYDEALGAGAAGGGDDDGSGENATGGDGVAVEFAHVDVRTVEVDG